MAAPLVWRAAERTGGTWVGIDVESGGEGPARSGDDGDANVGICFHHVQRILQVGDEPGVEGVQLVRTVEGEVGDGVPAFVDDVLE